MSGVVETREYVDGERRVTASVLDNGCVRFTGDGALSVVVLEQLVALARAAFDTRNVEEEEFLNANHLGPTGKRP